MKVGDRHFRTMWLNEDGHSVDIIDQRWLPHSFRIETLRSMKEVAVAIKDMWVRGAPLIGVTAACGISLQMRDDPSDDALEGAWAVLNETRPTAINQCSVRQGKAYRQLAAHSHHYPRDSGR